MSTENPDAKIENFDAQLRALEINGETETEAYAKSLESYAAYLKEKKNRLLDASNMAARANVIRDRLASTSAVPVVTQTKLDREHSSSDIRQVETEERSCPFCAETIKLAAIKCKHCGEFLKDAPTLSAKQENLIQPSNVQKRPIQSVKNRYLAGATLILFIALGVSFGFRLGGGGAITAGTKTDEGAITARAITSGTITGSAFVTKNGGGSEILRGLTITILKPEATEANDSVQALMKRANEIAQSYVGEDSLFPLCLKPAVSAAFEPYLLRTEKTNIDGKFKFGEVPPGKYMLAAQYSDISNYSLWELPITVEAGKECEVQLDNGRADVLMTIEPKPEGFLTFAMKADISKKEEEAMNKLDQWLHFEANRASSTTSAPSTIGSGASIPATVAPATTGKTNMRDLERRLEQQYGR